VAGDATCYMTRKRGMRKDVLLAFLERAGIACRKSWSKGRLVEVACTSATDALARQAAQSGLVVPCEAACAHQQDLLSLVRFYQVEFGLWLAATRW
jgi:hypothetical protein